VKDRINERADFPEPRHPDHRPPYVHLIPMTEIITKAVGQQNPFTQTVNRRWSELVSVFKSEINVLIDCNIEDIAKATAPAITEAIQAFREKKVIIHPGGGGQYGRIELPTDEMVTAMDLGPKDTQTSLSDY
jgi:PHP family Zn ribbon phosphoesterase